MRNVITRFLILLAALSAFLVPAFGQATQQAYYARVGGVFVASNFANYSGLTTTANTATGAQTYTVQFPGALRDGNNIPPFYVGEYLTWDEGALQETVAITTVSSVTCLGGGGGGGANPNCWNITSTFANAHGASTVVATGSAGLDEAINAANLSGGGQVSVDQTWYARGGSATIISQAPVFANVSILDTSAATVTQNGTNGGQWGQLYTPQPSALTALATPATRSATAGATQVISGTAVGTWTAVATYVCVTYVDIQGQESPCSATYNFTATASVALNFASPAASTGAVGWRAYAGITGYSTAYQLPISSSNCLLTTLETVQPACAIGAAGVFPTPTTTLKLHPGYVVATYNPNDLSHTTFAYQPSAKTPSSCTPESNFGPFLATSGGTTGQQEVIGSVELATGCLNYIGRTIRITGKIAATIVSTETPTIKVMLGPTFTTGTPTAICTLASTASMGGSVAVNGTFTCTITTNAIGATGTVMANAFGATQLQAGTTTASDVMVDTGTAAITDSVSTQDTLYIVWVGATAGDSAVQLLQLTVEDL